MLGDDFDLDVVPLYDCAQHSPQYLEKNPNHNVPALEITLDNGERRMMLESGAMVALLADLFPEKGLAPAPGVFITNLHRLRLKSSCEFYLISYDATGVIDTCMII